MKLGGESSVTSTVRSVSVWTLVGLGAAGVLLSYFGIWVLAAYFGAGLVWYASLALVMSGPISALGAAIALRKPRLQVAAAVGALGLIAWMALWAILFHAGWRITAV